MRFASFYALGYILLDPTRETDVPAKKKGKVGAARDPKRRAALAKQVKKEVKQGLHDGTFGKGNEFWQWRASNGPGFLYEGEEGARELLKEGMAYLEWCTANPLMEGKLVSFQGFSKVEQVPKMRVATQGGFCLHLGVSPSTYALWKSRSDLSEVILVIEGAIREYKFSGAAADLLNANIISRDLGLADKTELTGPGGAPIETVNTNMTAKEAADLYQQTRDQNKK